MSFTAEDKSHHLKTYPKFSSIHTKMVLKTYLLLLCFGEIGLLMQKISSTQLTMTFVHVFIMPILVKIGEKEVNKMMPYTPNKNCSFQHKSKPLEKFHQKLLQGHSLLTLSIYRACPNRSSFPEDKCENVTKNNYNIMPMSAHPAVLLRTVKLMVLFLSWEHQRACRLLADNYNTQF